MKAFKCDKCGKIWGVTESDYFNEDGARHYCKSCVPSQVFRVKKFAEVISCNDDALLNGTSIECFLPEGCLTDSQVEYIQELAKPYSIIVNILPFINKLIIDIIV